jgi:hypothetical protein
MPRKKEDAEIMEIEPKTDQTGALKAAMLEVGLKLCQDLINGKARDEKTALTAIVDIYEAINGPGV